MLAGHRATDDEEASCGPQRVLRLAVYIRYKAGVAHLKQAGVIEQGAVDAALVEALLMHIAEATGLQRLLAAEVIEALGVLHLSHPNHGTAHAGQLVGAHLREHTRHVGQLMGVFLLCPLIGAVGQKLIVVLTHVMASVKEILQIIEAHAIDGKTLLLGLQGHRAANQQHSQ